MTARQGARAALALGLAASLAGNVIAAHPTALGRLVAAWPPLALLVAIELVTRIPSRSGALSALRLGSAGLLAIIAAWVSYWHLAELARAAGEGGIAAHLLPLSVDGLVAVASVCLREVGAQPPAPSTPTPRPARASASRAETAPRDAGAPTAPAARRHPTSSTRSSGDEVRRLAAEHPDWTRAELAAAAGCSARTVRRHLASVSLDGRSLDDELAALAAFVDPDSVSARAQSSGPDPAIDALQEQTL